MADQNLNSIFGDPRERFDRFKKAQNIMIQWREILECAYRFSIPNREDFDNVDGSSNRGEEKTNDVFDSTAVSGVKEFANTIQSSLMPIGQEWANLTPGDQIIERTDLDASDPNFISPSDLKEIEEQLQKRTSTLFRNLERTNFNQVVSTAFMDYAISVGTVVVNEGDESIPLEFMALPISQMAYEEGASARLENFWRRYELSLRLLVQRFPEAVLPQDLVGLLKTNPNHLVIIVEGCIRNPNQPIDEQFMYYVQLEGHNNMDLFKEVRSYNPFTAFRMSVAPGEILGRGVIIDQLPNIRSLNQMAGDELKANSWRVNPAYFIENNGVFNPNVETLEAGSLVVIEPSIAGGKDPIRPVQVGGDVQYQQLSIQRLQETIKEALFTDPLGPPLQTTNQSATQTAIRQQNSIQKRAAFTSRFVSEFFIPMLDKIITILSKKNILKDIILEDGTRIQMKLNDRTLGVNFTSPIIDVQNQQDIQKLDGMAQFIAGNFGQEGMAVAFKLALLPQYVAGKFGVDLKLINNAVEAKKIIEDTTNQIQQQNAVQSLTPQQTLAESQPQQQPQQQ